MSTEKRRVLVVDDDPVIALTMAAILQREGYETLTAFNGDTAVQEARTFQPHLLLTDICMPARDGIDTACEVMMICPKCQIMLVSGHPCAPAMVERFLPRFTVMAKPLHPRDLIKSVASVLPPKQTLRSA